MHIFKIPIFVLNRAIFLISKAKIDKKSLTGVIILIIGSFLLELLVEDFDVGSD